MTRARVSWAKRPEPAVDVTFQSSSLSCLMLTPSLNAVPNPRYDCTGTVPVPVHFTSTNKIISFEQGWWQDGPLLKSVR